MAPISEHQSYWHPVNVSTSSRKVAALNKVHAVRSWYAHRESMLGLVMQYMHAILGSTIAHSKLDRFVTKQKDLVYANVTA